MNIKILLNKMTFLTNEVRLRIKYHSKYISNDIETQCILEDSKSHLYSFCNKLCFNLHRYE